MFLILAFTGRKQRVCPARQCTSYPFSLLNQIGVPGFNLYRQGLDNENKPNVANVGICGDSLMRGWLRFVVGANGQGSVEKRSRSEASADEDGSEGSASQTGRSVEAAGSTATAATAAEADDYG